MGTVGSGGASTLKVLESCLESGSPWCCFQRCLSQENLMATLRICASQLLGIIVANARPPRSHPLTTTHFHVCFMHHTLAATGVPHCYPTAIFSAAAKRS